MNTLRLQFIQILYKIQLLPHREKLHLQYEDHQLRLFREIFIVYPDKNIKYHKTGNVRIT